MSLSVCVYTCMCVHGGMVDLATCQLTESMEASHGKFVTLFVEQIDRQTDRQLTSRMWERRIQNIPLIDAPELSVYE